MSEPTIEQLVKVRNKIDGARKDATKAYETKDGELKAQLEKIDVALLAALDKAGLKSAKTEHGTVYKQIEIQPIGNDWSLFYGWIMEDVDRMDFLQKRIKVTSITDYMDAHKDDDDNPLLPPGVSVMRKYVARVRKN